MNELSPLEVVFLFALWCLIGTHIILGIYLMFMFCLGFSGWIIGGILFGLQDMFNEGKKIFQKLKSRKTWASLKLKFNSCFRR